MSLQLIILPGALLRAQFEFGQELPLQDERSHLHRIIYPSVEIGGQFFLRFWRQKRERKKKLDN